MDIKIIICVSKKFNQCLQLFLILFLQNFLLNFESRVLIISQAHSCQLVKSVSDHKSAQSIIYIFKLENDLSLLQFVIVRTRRMRGTISTLEKQSFTPLLINILYVKFS